MNASARIATPVEVLARLDTHKREPVMFLRSTINSKGDVTVWRNGQEERSTVDFYGTTAPLNAKDEKIMVKRFADAYGITPEDVHLNRRLPRTPRDRKSILRELAAPQPQAQQPAAAPVAASHIPGVDAETLKALLAAFPGLQSLMQPQAAATTPTEQPAAPAASTPALTLVHDAMAQEAAAPAATPAEQPEQAAAAQQTEQATNNSKPRRMTKAQKKQARSEAAKRAAQTRAANRAGNAKPLDTQPLPQGPQGDLPQPGETPAPMPQGVDKIAPTVNATPDQVAARIAAIREQMNAQIDDVLKTLTPHEPATQK